MEPKTPKDPWYNFSEGQLKQEDIDDLLEDGIPSKLVIAYKHMPTESVLCKDLVALWNTPDRCNAYIIIGVKTDSGRIKVVGFDGDPVSEFEFLNRPSLWAELC